MTCEWLRCRAERGGGVLECCRCTASLTATCVRGVKLSSTRGDSRLRMRSRGSGDWV
jgi:hypothetical protein